MAARNNASLNKHSEETVQLGLRTLALCGGNAGRAAKLLASDESVTDPPAKRTLQSWKDSVHASRYLEVLHETQREVSARTADQAMELAGKATNAEQTLIDKTVAKADEIEPKDLARSALAMTQVKAENVRTSRLLRDQPTSISEVRDVAEIIAELKALEIARTKKDDEAIDAEVVEETVTDHKVSSPQALRMP